MFDWTEFYLGIARIKEGNAISVVYLGTGWIREEKKKKENTVIILECTNSGQYKPFLQFCMF